MKIMVPIRAFCKITWGSLTVYRPKLASLAQKNRHDEIKICSTLLKTKIRKIIVSIIKGCTEVNKTIKFNDFGIEKNEIRLMVYVSGQWGFCFHSLINYPRKLPIKYVYKSIDRMNFPGMQRLPFAIGKQLNDWWCSCSMTRVQSAICLKLNFFCSGL